MGLVIAFDIGKAYWNNECRNFIIYGPLGYGKTSYALHTLMEIYKTHDPEVLDKYFAFTPQEFLRKVRGFKPRVETICWDDAGVWLYYMDYNHPIIKKLAKMMQVIRTRASSVILTTPSPTLILGKLRNFPQTLTIKIIKNPGNQYQQDKRRATAYRSYLLPDLQKLRIKKMFIDDFSVMLPNDVYKWFNDKREVYVEQLEADIDNDLTPKMQLAGLV